MTYGPPNLSVARVEDADDERVADYVGLSDAQARRRIERPGAEGIFVAEGMVVIGQLLRSPYRIRSILVTDRGLRALEAELVDPALACSAVDTPVYLATQPVMEAIAGFRFHRGALAAADRMRLPAADELAAGAARLLLVEGVGDNENLGALFRNAAALGVDAVLLDPTTCDPLYRRSVRVSAGQILRLPFARMADWPAGAVVGHPHVEAVRSRHRGRGRQPHPYRMADWPAGAVAALQERGFEVLALTPSRSADDLRTLPPHPRRALLVGAEGDGLSAGALAAADRRVRVAMAPGVDSLNVATAAAIALHHLSAPPA